MKYRYPILTAFFSSILLFIMILIPFTIIDPSEALSSTLDSFSSGHPLYSFLLTLTMILFGTSSIISGWKKFNGIAFQRFMLLIFACTFIVAAVFINLEQYNSFIDSTSAKTIHRCFSAMAVISFSALTASTALILSENRGRIISFLTAVAVIFTVLIQSESEKYAGLWQRMIIALIAGWMLYINKNSELN